MVDFKDLIKAGVHFGHRCSVWSPRMEPYIWGHKNNVHLIDVSKTAVQLEKAAQFLESVAAEGKPILWVGTKKPAQGIIYSVAERLGMPYVTHRWVGGTLSNHPQVKKSVTKLLHYEDILARAEKYPYYTKKELNTFQKVVERLKKNVGGIVNLKWPIGAIVLVDIKKESSALKEAIVMGIPVVALVDTNSDPSLVDYVIPGNDDAPRSIKFVIDYLEESVNRGKEKSAAKKDVSKVQEEEVLEEADVTIVLDEDETEEQKKSKRAAKKALEETKRKPLKAAREKDEPEKKRAIKPRPVSKDKSEPLQSESKPAKKK